MSDQDNYIRMSSPHRDGARSWQDGEPRDLREGEGAGNLQDEVLDHEAEVPFKSGIELIEALW